MCYVDIGYCCYRLLLLLVTVAIDYCYYWLLLLSVTVTIGVLI